ncbi:AMP-binding protein [Cryobacterium roopkundense]|uniref:O-succinylbenzoic acid--CoA ligase n=1 Tax=Cryobacterium roopkundense TaxID=1001240 RepID=A0A7W9E6J0_9MICO|nr:AMP-binding protein [Cryobacterium roopkundense]MBB5643479.1 O-succinylbenzoic acid--CoA ligase [Cryobacterium roopkundense]
MTRTLRAVQVSGRGAPDPLELMALLRGALTSSGDALMPVAASAAPRDGLTVPRSVAVVIETSGSTDAPKRVMLSTDALLAGAAASSDALGGPGQWLLALPTHYIAGLQVLVRSIAAVTTPVVLAPGHFDAHAFRNLAETMTEPLRYTSLVPVQLARLCDAATDDLRTRAVLRRFTAILVGGQAMPSELQTRAEELDLRVVRTYGSSETAGGCVYNGVPIGNTRVRAVGGQLEISGAVLAEGYLGEPERTRQRFSEVHGVRWYRTGDLGTVDPLSGVVRVLGRADNVIISGGVKVSLDEVEAIVRAFPGLENAVVVAANDPEWGQVPVIVAAGSSATRVELVETSVETRIADAVSSVLGRAARPARFVIVPSIPLLTSGKPDRRAITAAL